MTEKMADAFDQEVSVMHYLGRHPNIAGLLGWCYEPMAMLMKFYQHGSLNQFIKSDKAGSKFLKLTFTLNISRGLSFMHSKGVAHCDMKPESVLVDQEEYGRLFCALTDFGISQMYTDSAQLVGVFKVVNFKGASIAYAAPEIVTRLRTHSAECTKELAFAGDVYGFGMIAVVLLNTTDGWK